MIHQSSVYQETINQKSQIEKDFWVIKPVSTSICFSLVSVDFIHISVLVCVNAMHTYAHACMCMFNFLSPAGGYALDGVWLWASAILPPTLILIIIN